MTRWRVIDHASYNRIMGFIWHPIASLNHLIARLVTDKITFWLAILLFIYLSLSYKNSFWKQVDNSAYNWGLELKWKFFKNHAEDLAIFGNAIFHIAFSIVLAIIFFVFLHEEKSAISILFVLIFSWGLNRFVKIIYKRERPERIASNVRKRLSHSFPSGHVMASIGIYFFSAVLLQGKLHFLPCYLLAFLLVATVVSTRIYLNHHFFTDVLAGIALGIFCLDVSIWFYFFLSVV